MNLIVRWTRDDIGCSPISHKYLLYHIFYAFQDKVSILYIYGLLIAINHLALLIGLSMTNVDNVTKPNIFIHLWQTCTL